MEKIVNAINGIKDVMDKVQSENLDRFIELSRHVKELITCNAELLRRVKALEEQVNKPNA